MARLDGIRAVTYDCWGTLLQDRDWAGSQQIRREALRAAVDLKEQEAMDLLDEAWRKHDEAWKQIETFGPGRMAAYCLEAKGIFEDEAIRDLTRRFEEASLSGGVEAVEGAAETLGKLREAGIRIALVCDTGFSSGRVVRELLRDEGLLDLLDAHCFSDEVGVPKPGNDIFAKALAELGARPPEAVHVGDLKRTDIAGAHDVGMRTVRFKGVHDDASDAREADCVISRHEELFDCIGLP